MTSDPNPNDNQVAPEGSADEPATEEATGARVSVAPRPSAAPRPSKAAPAPDADAAVDPPADDVLFVEGGDVVAEDEGGEDAGRGDDPPPPSREQELEEALQAVETERDRMRDQLIRTAADFDNFRKRTRRELTDAQRKGKEDTLRDVLDVIDNLERAVAASSNAADVKSVADGVRMVLRQFEEVANRLQLERLKVIGEKFDPTLHDAVQQVESADVEPGTITVEVQAGYRVGEKLLRPAVVVVAKAPQVSAEGAAPNPGPTPSKRPSQAPPTAEAAGASGVSDRPTSERVAVPPRGSERPPASPEVTDGGGADGADGNDGSPKP